MWSIVTNFMKQSPFWDANSLSASEEILSHSSQYSQESATGPHLEWGDTDAQSHILFIMFHLILSSIMLVLWSSLFSSGFHLKFCLLRLSPHACYMSHTCNIPQFDFCNSISEIVTFNCFTLHKNISEYKCPITIFYL